jgi:pyrroline-5-carboxylate reductase
MKILIIGGGSMGQAFARGLGTMGIHSIGVVERDENIAATCRALGTQTFSTMADANSFSDAEVCILAVKPADITTAANDVAALLTDSTVIISIAAGVSLTSLSQHLQGFSIVRAMPNVGAAQLVSATAMCTIDTIAESDVEKAHSVLESVGLVVRVSEKKINAVTAVSGSGPAYFFLLAEQLLAAAEKLGLEPETAQQLVAQTMIGAAKLVDENGSFAALREKVTSKGGTTEAALNSFADDEFGEIVEKAVTAAAKRASELDS